MQELIEKFEELKNKILATKKLLDLEAKKQEIKKLETRVNQPNFWKDQEKARKVSQELSDLNGEVGQWEELHKEVDDGLSLVNEALKTKKQENKKTNGDFFNDLEKEYERLLEKYDELEFYVLLSGKYDKNNAILAIHAGAGGDDAQDWAEMLLRMFLRYCENKGFKTGIIDKSAGSEAGLKSAVVEVIGKHAYGFLKSEAGVHRLVRISPFDAEKMRHTSFAMVEVLPELEDIDVDIKDEDLRIDTFCASGHGGQSVNTTYSAVRIVHLPTKITVSCQNERSQTQNKETALKILKSKIYQYYQAEKEEEKQQLRGEFKEAAWGNQIRSYVLHPYKMVKDHRTEFETQDVGSVLDGGLEEFVGAFLKSQIDG
ncbi:peptide chain release factor 2 [Patescibacteria group bacterium]|nr:peptide chain release factor 2 [Patescibacteria group bacterium]